MPARKIKKGRWVFEDVNCPYCSGQGRLYPQGREIQAIWSNPAIEDYFTLLGAVFALRETPVMPREWLAQPALLAATHRLVTPILRGEFEKRDKALRKGKPGHGSETG